MKVTVANTLWEKTRGLLGTTQAYPLLLKTRWGIHTLGMTYPIDIVVLDTHQTIVHLKENLKPNNIFFWNPKYDLILELPKGTIKNEQLKLGKKIKLEIS